MRRWQKTNSQFQTAMQRIRDYEIISRIASGGMGTVYLAQHTGTRRNVALKVLAARANDDPEFVARFRREGHAIASLDHPHIVKVFDAGCANEFCYLAMEYLNYGTLKERIQKFKGQGECMPVNDALEVARQIAMALDHAHLKGLVHRDVKPANIMLAAGGRYVLTDFGVAFVKGGTRLTRDDGQLIGTAEYMAPERIKAVMDANTPTTHNYDPRSDVYALGVVLYEMLTGCAPFTGETEMVILFAHVHRAAVPIRQLRPDLSRPVCRLVEKAMAKQPELRFLSAGELAAALTTVLTSEPTRPRLHFVLRPRKFVMAGLVAVMLVAAVVVVGAWVWHPPASARVKPIVPVARFKFAQVQFVAIDTSIVRTSPQLAAHEVDVLQPNHPAVVLGRSADGQWLQLEMATQKIGWVQRSDGNLMGKLSAVPVVPIAGLNDGGEL
jgi:serine/threonine protein kinase